MAAKKKIPVTPATRLLKQKKVAFKPGLYEYEEHGGTEVAARELGLDEHLVVKTLVLEDEAKKPLIVVMHGDLEVSTKNLARHLGVKTVKPCDPATAAKHTGYMVGGTSPFGTKKRLPVYVEETIFDLKMVAINGGKRGFLMEIDPAVLRELLGAEPVKVGI